MKNHNVRKLEALTPNTLIIGVDIAEENSGQGSLIIVVSNIVIGGYLYEE